MDGKINTTSNKLEEETFLSVHRRQQHRHRNSGNIFSASSVKCTSNLSALGCKFCLLHGALPPQFLCNTRQHQSADAAAAAAVCSPFIAALAATAH